MSRADGLLTKVNNVMRKFAPLTRTVYKRTVTRTGGNDLIGRAGTTTVVDTICDPQPVAEQMGRTAMAGGRLSPVESLMISTGQRTADTWKVLFSPNALSLTELQGKNLQLVFKDASGNAEVLEIFDFEPTGMNGTTVLITVYARSIKRA